MYQKWKVWLAECCGVQSNRGEYVHMHPNGGKSGLGGQSVGPCFLLSSRHSVAQTLKFRPDCIIYKKEEIEGQHVAVLEMHTVMMTTETTEEQKQASKQAAA